MSSNWLAEEVAADSRKLSKRSHKIRIISYSIGVLLVITVIALVSSIKPAKSVAAQITGSIPTGVSAEATPSNTPIPFPTSSIIASTSYVPPINESFSVPTYSFPTSAGTVSIPSYTYTPPTPTQSCAYSSQIASSSQNVTQAENQLSNDEQASQTSAMPNGGSSYGVSAAQHAGAWQSALQADQNNVASAQNTLSYYESQPGC